ncbi:MAG: phosphopantetheine-binding protein [Oscillospiraceae bacterium]|jgi:acyl carrier protein|nr:phosphopantetheine-binding protein [Oscillospiraceae bacterium]
MVLDKLKDMLSAQLGADADVIGADTDIVNDLGADSLDVAELMMGIEVEFGLLLTEEQLADVHTVGELAVLVDNCLLSI